MEPYAASRHAERMLIRGTQAGERPRIRPFLHAIVAAGETFTCPVAFCDSAHGYVGPHIMHCRL